MISICIVIQSEAFAVSAGMRIRYLRFIEGSAGLGVKIVAHPLADLINSPIDHDIYVFCKTFSIDAILFAQRAKKYNKRVAQDLFDDYFSQRADQRLLPYRDWLRSMAMYTDVAVCTTKRMQSLVQPLLGDTVVHIVEDPVEGYDAVRTGRLADAKIAAAQAERTLRLVWFGIGDNPFFNVGIANLTAPSSLHALSALAYSNFNVSLKIITNARSVDVAGLASLRALPLDYEVVEWSEEAERKALREADIALLPVGYQSFSMAKSLNRALTTLVEGCQILSLDADIYHDLNLTLYRDVRKLISDYTEGKPTLNSENLEFLTNFIQQRANPTSLADNFVSGLLTAPSRSVRPLAVIHGRDLKIGVHKMASAAGVSVRTPFVTAIWNFELRFDYRKDSVVARISALFAERHSVRIVPGTEQKIGDLVFLDVAPDLYEPIENVLNIRSAEAVATVVQYDRIIHAVIRATRSILPTHDVLLNDSSHLRSDLSRNAI